MKITETNLYKATKTWVDYMTGADCQSFDDEYDALKREQKMLADMVAAVKKAEENEAYSEASVWVRDDERTINVTMLLSEEHFNGPVTSNRVANWTDEECQAVENYCISVHIQASDNDDYPVPPKPSVLEHL
jgi:hypothetical protein